MIPHRIRRRLCAERVRVILIHDRVLNMKKEFNEFEKFLRSIKRKDPELFKIIEDEYALESVRYCNPVVNEIWERQKFIAEMDLDFILLAHSL
jgi:hypothetical protein